MVVAVIAALASAACFATASVLQQRAARVAPRSEALRPRLLIDLFQRSGWLAGFAASALGFALQAVALHFGGLVLVQPLILTDVIFALPFAVRLRNHRMGPREWASTVTITGGLALFLVVAAPHGGRPDPPMSTWALIVAGIGLAIGLCLLLSRVGTLRATLLGVCAGVSFGLLAALLDSVTYLVAHHGFLGALTNWQPYLLGVVAPTGELFAQSAYQAGPLPASLPAMDALDPGSAIVIGLAAFGEHFDHSGAAIAIEALGLLAVITGIVILDRSPLILALQRDMTSKSKPPN